MSPLNLDEARAFLAREFPQIDGSLAVEEVGPMRARLRLIAHPRNLRPGGTVSGPAMFALADVALYVAILASVGPLALAVTTHLNINFLRKPEPGDLIGAARLLKIGKRLAVGEVSISAPGADEVLAHAVGGYSLPRDCEPVS